MAFEQGHVWDDGAGPMQVDLSDKVALVTGGAGAIGRAIVAVLAANGAFVAIVDLDGEAAERAVQDVTEAGGAGLALVG